MPCALLFLQYMTHEQLAPLIPSSTKRETCKHCHLLHTKAFQLFLKLKQWYYNYRRGKCCEPGNYKQDISC